MTGGIWYAKDYTNTAEQWPLTSQIRISNGVKCGAPIYMISPNKAGVFYITANTVKLQSAKIIHHIGGRCSGAVWKIWVDMVHIRVKKSGRASTN